MDIQQNRNIASNSKRFYKMAFLLDYCMDYFSGQKHKIKNIVKKRAVGKIESFWQYVGDYLSGNKYGYKKSCEEQR